MSHEEQVGKNFAWGILSQIVSRVFGLMFFVYMSFMLLEKGMGQYNFIASFSIFWFIFTDFGIGSYLYREWSRGNVAMEVIKKDFNLVLTLKLLMSLIIFIPFIILNWFLNKDIFLALILYYLYIILSMISSQADTYLQSINNFKLGAIRSIIEKMTIILLGGLLLFFFRNVVSVFIAMIIAQFVSIFYYFSGRFPFSPKIYFDWFQVVQLIKKGLPFALFAIFVSVYGRIDMVMLRFMQNFETVGWYSAGYKAYEIANIFPALLFLPAIFPILSRIYSQEDRKKYNEFLNKSIRILFSTSILISIFFIFSAPYLIGYFFPDSFFPSVLVMRIIILVLTISFLSTLFVNLIVIQNKEKISLKIVIFSCMANVALNFLLIPKYSLYGAAVATVIAEGFNLFLLQHYAEWKKDVKMLIKMFFVGIFIVISLFFIKMLGYMNNLFVGLSFFMSIVILFISLKLIQKNDLQMFYLPIKNKFKNVFFNNSEI